ncbi:MAG: oligosaccharide flippase family protein, partial [Paramuribaculum sp.]|nr:oligosaccharide flippase family protein [Paramuribaculum sp.]
MIRGKFAALLLGVGGMGVASLYASAAAVVQQIAVAGLNLAVVREISGISDDEEACRVAATVSRRLTDLCAVGGVILCLLLSPLLSLLTFGSYEYTVGFMCLSLMVGLSVAATGHQALLQATRSLRPLAGATICSTVVSVVVAVPLYWFFSVNGIVPAMIAGSLSGLWFYSRAVGRLRLYGGSVGVRLRDHKPLVRRLLRSGMSLMAVGAMSVGVTFAVNVWLRAEAGESSVAMYNAASSVSSQCASLVFMAMAMDYFPRISALAGDRKAMSGVVEHQIRAVLTVLAPMSCLLSAMAPLVTGLLFSSEFDGMIPMLRWLSVAMVLKGVSYPLGYVPLAMGHRRLYFRLEGIYGTVTVFAAVAAGYVAGGLEGIGVAMCAVYTLDIAVYAMVCCRCFGVLPGGRTLS